jgi:2-polyprenyl-3-methyl-5-hydroxy-6-metoxy-1,4-benzoquinol methylase
MADGAATERFAQQAAQYSFPYHWLPSNDQGSWNISRALGWGLEYLAVMETTKTVVLGVGPHRVLDLGCGDGRLSYELLTAGVDEVVGVDLVEQAVAFARAFNAVHGDRARFACEPVQSLPETAFDAAVAMEVLEHIPEGQLGEVLEAVRRRLRPAGCLVVSVPTTNVPLHPKHERHYTAPLLRAHLRPGFEIEDIRYVHRDTVVSRNLRRLLTNRLVHLNEPSLIRHVVRCYQRHAWTASAQDGTHIVAVCRRRDA